MCVYVCAHTLVKEMQFAIHTFTDGLFTTFFLDRYNTHYTIEDIP